MTGHFPCARRSGRAMLLAGLSVLAFTAPALAQEGAPADEQAHAPVSGGIADIVVTAQRRAQRLQDVPVAITAFDSAALETRNVTTLGDLEGLAPNTKFTTGGGYVASTVISMRGGYSPNPVPFNEPPSGMYVDGVYIGKSNGQLFAIADLESVEVLRGPQGTLFGRNALSGAINVTTKKPSGEWGGYVKAGFGNYQQRSLRLSLDLPRIGDFSVKLSGLIDRHEGYIRNAATPSTAPSVIPARPTTNDRLDATNDKAARVAVRYDPTSNFTVDYAFDYSRTRAAPRFSQLLNVDAGSIFDQNSPIYAGIPLDDFVLGLKRSGQGYSNGSVNNHDLYERVKVWGHSLIATLDLDAVTLKSITAYRRMNWTASMDLDGSPYPIASIIQTFRYHAFSQELQAIGKLGNRLNYTAGLFFYDDGGPSQNPQQFFGDAVYTDSRYSTSARAYAAYLQADWVPPILDDRLTITAGIRYSHEKKGTKRFLATVDSATGEQIGPPAIPWTSATSSFSGVTPTAIVKYDINDDVNVYAKYAQGFRSGGFSGDATTLQDVVTPFKSEKLYSYEIGMKGRFIDGRLTVNADYFWNQHRRMQLLVFTGLQFGTAATAIRNAGSADIHGLEVEVQALPVDWLKLQGTIGTLHGKYNSFIENGVDVKDDRALPSTPKLSGSASGDIRFFQSEVYGDLHLTVDYTHQDFNYNTPTISPFFANDEQNIVDANLRLTNIPAGSGTLEAGLWVRNLFNTFHRTWSIDFGDSFGGLAVGYYNPPRTYGFDLTFRF